MALFITRKETLKEVTLRFKRDTLWVYGKNYDPLVMEAIRLGGSIGLEVPKVSVVRVRRHDYQLVYGPGGGGHHRSILGYEDGSLTAYLAEDHYFDIKDISFHRIQDMVPIENRAKDWIFERAWTARLKRSLSYLPKEVARQFCFDYDLDPKVLESLPFLS